MDNIVIMFRKKPVVIEAVLWDGKEETYLGIQNWMGAKASDVGCILQNELRIWTLEGVMVANIGDWIIKGVKGEFYPCKPDIFQATYETLGD